MPCASHPRLQWLVLAACCVSSLGAQTTAAPGQEAHVIARLVTVQRDATHKLEKASPAVIWLNPQRPGATALAPAVRDNFTLLMGGASILDFMKQVRHAAWCSHAKASPIFSATFIPR